MEFSCPENVWALTICWEQKEEIFACFKFGDTSVFSRLLIIIVVVVIVLCLQCLCLQCFDAVGWAAGRASGL